MASKLDQPLDNLLAARKKQRGPLRRTGRANAGAKPATAAPVGGVKKATRPAKKDTRIQAPTAPAAKGRGDSKITVSNLPLDVTEQQIKEYFQSSVAPVKRAILNYGPNGQSRGTATVFFANATAASKAAKEQNGIKVDGKPMRIDILVDGRDAPALPEPKKLADRVSTPKNAANAKPKPATQTKADKAGVGKKKGAQGARPKRQGRVKKTAEDLDAEMVDYFGTGEQAPAPASEKPAGAGGDTAMAEDTI